MRRPGSDRSGIRESSLRTRVIDSSARRLASCEVIRRAHEVRSDLSRANRAPQLAPPVAIAVFSVSSVISPRAWPRSSARRARSWKSGSGMQRRRSVPARIMAMISTTWAGPWSSAPMSRASEITTRSNPSSDLTNPLIPISGGAYRYLAASGEGRDHLMGHHQQLRPGGDPCSKRGQFDLLQPVALEAQQRELVVRVDLSFAAAGEMLEGGQ